jgi:Spy/CpxP family protein refolding chaperone
MPHTRRSVAILVLVFAATALLAAANTGILWAGVQEPFQQAPAPPPGGPDGRGGRGGPGGPGGQSVFGPELFELDLTVEQLQQVKAIRDEARTSATPYRELLRRAQKELNALVASDKFDQSAARSLAETEGKGMTEIRVINARADAAIYQILTADQRTALEQSRRRKPPAR